MKQFSFAAVLLLLSSFSFAQAPQSIPYQAVARDASGNLLQNTTICVQFRIYNVASGGTPIYEEYQTATTNKLGLFNLNVGSTAAHVQIGTNLGAVNWGSTATYMELGLDVSGGCSGSNTYTTMGRSQMISVPFALYAGSAASASGTAGGDLTGSYPNPTLAPSGVTANTYGSSSTYPVITVDSKGRVTNVTTDALPASLPPSGTAGGDLTGSYPNPSLTTTGVTANTYGNSSTYPVVTVDSKGRVTNITTDALPVVAFTNGAGISVTGAYPNFTIANTSPSSGGTVTSITASSPLTGGTITGSGSIGIGQASSSSNGYLASGDWTTFNNKVNGTSTQYYVPHWTTTSTSTGTLSSTGMIYDNGSDVGIGTNSPGSNTLAINGAAAIWNGNDLNYYSDAGTTKNAYVGPGRNGDFSIVEAASNWLRISNTTSIAFWSNGNGATDDNPQMILSSGNLTVSSLATTSTSGLYPVYATSTGQLVTGVPTAGNFINRQAFNYGSHTTVVTSPNTWTWTAPSGVTKIFVKLWGAGGGCTGGGGGFVSGTMAVTPGTTYYVIVGQGGYTSSSTYQCGGGGLSYSGGNGGGRSAIRSNLSGADLVTAGGGGGGNGCNSGEPGGAGGNTLGGSAGSSSIGNSCNCAAAVTGGSQSGGGCPPGSCSNGSGSQYIGGCGLYNGIVSNASSLAVGIGGNAATKGAAGGGGGYYGGGGGNESSGAGGGSNYTGGLSVVTACMQGGTYNSGTKGSAANTGDSDYASGTATSNSSGICGQGGNNCGDGGDGYVVIYW